MKTLISGLVPASNDRARLALEVECTPAYMEQIACGRMHPSRKLANRIAEALARQGIEVKPEELVVGRRYDATDAEHRVSRALAKLAELRAEVDRLEGILQGEAA